MTWTPVFAKKYKTLKVADNKAGVCVATICSSDEVGLNLLTARLLRELADCVEHVSKDDTVHVFVLRSSDPEFWLAHLDINTVLKLKPSQPGEREVVYNTWHSLCDQLRNMPKATIAEVAGRVGGGGSEICLNFDMRFGVQGLTRFCQMEVPLGISPGGTGCVTLPQLVGVGRAMEMILSGADIDAELAERWGLLNRCFPDAATCRAHVDALATRIAGFLPHAVRAAKASVLAAERMPRREACLEGLSLFNRTLGDSDTRRRLEGFLNKGGQTRQGELDLQGTLTKVSKL
mmetsp:Transcript_114997/g.330313  ORF Transcript_114997/g.330313 Transcript_114997/m.330313 type:complete len:290 (-) Transcript_114997:150-1019(-)